MRRSILAAMAFTGCCISASAWAQVSNADQIAEQWRVAKRAELTAQREALDKQIKALDDGATPDDLPAKAAPQPLVVDPGGNALVAAPAILSLNQSSAEALVTSAAAAIDKTEEDRATKKFGGIELGAGISYTRDMGGVKRVSEASIVNGVVRVIDEDNSRARIMFESHYFFTPSGTLFGRYNSPVDAKTREQEHKQWGIGPFVAVQGGTNDVIEAIGAGIMIGFRRDPKTTESFNIGLGVVVDPDTKVLGDGIVANQPLPAGETEIRYKEEAQYGLFGLVSFSF